MKARGSDPSLTTPSPVSVPGACGKRAATARRAGARAARASRARHGRSG